MEAALTGISGALFVYCLLFLSFGCLEAFVATVDGRHGLGSRLGLLGLFVFGLLFLGFISPKMT